MSLTVSADENTWKHFLDDIIKHIFDFEVRRLSQTQTLFLIFTLLHHSQNFYHDSLLELVTSAQQNLLSQSSFVQEHIASVQDRPSIALKLAQAYCDAGNYRQSYEVLSSRPIQEQSKIEAFVRAYSLYLVCFDSSHDTILFRLVSF